MRKSSHVFVPAPNQSTNRPQLTFTRYPGRTGITLTAQASDSLGTWTDLTASVDGAAFTIITPGATIMEAGSGDTRSVTLTDLYPANDAAHPKRFMRLRVTAP